MFNKLPKKVRLAILLIEALDLSLGLKLAQTIIYLWREFGVKLSIKPIIKNFVINYHYKDTCLMSFSTNDLKDIIKVTEEIKKSRVSEEIKLLEDKFKKDKGLDK